MLEDLDPNRDYLPGREAQGSSRAEYVVGRQSPEKEDDRFGNRVGGLSLQEQQSENQPKTQGHLNVPAVALLLLGSTGWLAGY